MEGNSQNSDDTEEIINEHSDDDKRTYDNAAMEDRRETRPIRRPLEFMGPTVGGGGFGQDADGGVYEADNQDPGDDSGGMSYTICIPLVLIPAGLLYWYFYYEPNSGSGGGGSMRMGWVECGSYGTLIGMLFLALVISTIVLAYLIQQQKKEEAALYVQRNLAAAAFFVFSGVCVYLLMENGGFPSIFGGADITGEADPGDALYATTYKMFLLKVAGLGLITLTCLLAVMIFIVVHLAAVRAVAPPRPQAPAPAQGQPRPPPGQRRGRFAPGHPPPFIPGGGNRLRCDCDGRRRQ